MRIQRGSQYCLLALWLAWTLGLLLIYYRQVWLSPEENLALVWSNLGNLLPLLGIGLGAALLLFLAQRVGRKISQLLREEKFTKPSQLLYGTLLEFGGLTIYVALSYLFIRRVLLPGLPYFSEAVERNVLGIIGAGLALLASQFLGLGVCRLLLRWQFQDWRDRWLYHSTIGLGALAYLSLGLATLGIYYRLSIQILVATVLVAGSVWLGYYLKSGNSSQAGSAATPRLASTIGPADRIWQGITLFAIAIAFVCALAPEQEFDALSYHLSFPQMWLEAGYLVDLPAQYVSLYPMTWELIFGAGLALGGPIAAKLLHFISLPLTALLTYQLTRRFVVEVSPWLASAFLVTVPIVLWEATSAYVDLALALHVGLVLYALWQYVQERHWQWLALAALNLGLALASKHLALFVLALAAIGLFLQLWFQTRNFRQAVIPAIALSLGSLVLPFPWYLRSWRASGNPVFPELFSLFGAPADRWDAVSERGLDHFLEQFGRPDSLLNLLTLPWDMTVNAADYGGTLGPLFLLFLPGWIFIRRYSAAASWFVGFVVLYVALWASPFCSFQMRFLVPITPLLAILAAASCEGLAHWLNSLVKGGGLVFYTGLAVLLPLNLPPFLPLHEGNRVGWTGWLTHVIRELPLPVVVGQTSEATYLQKTVPSYAAWQYINAHLPKTARILTFSDGDQFYSDRDRLWSDATIARPATWGATRGQEQQALQALHQLGISHILFDQKQLKSLPVDTLAIAQPEVLQAWYEEVYKDNRYILYRVQWENLTLQR